MPHFVDSVDPDGRAVLCVGELLWDVFPDARKLGGAPPNVACHLAQSGRPARIASRVGRDPEGAEALAAIRAHGVDASLVQEDAELPTGTVIVSFADPQTPEYDIVAPAAWDRITITEDLLAAAASAWAVVYGSLAQRDPVSAAAVQACAANARLRVYDVNLRPPHTPRETVERSLASAGLVKLNDGELDALTDWFDLPQCPREACEALRDRFGVEAVCVTRGARGAALLIGAEWVDDPGFRVDVVDAVGAGDAFLAALLDGLAARRPPQDVLIRANAHGAWVATQAGATPAADPEAVDRILSNRRE